MRLLDGGKGGALVEHRNAIVYLGRVSLDCINFTLPRRADFWTFRGTRLDLAGATIARRIIRTVDEAEYRCLEFACISMHVLTCAMQCDAGSRERTFVHTGRTHARTQCGPLA